jgi:mono/diheme cytochrome c family protein
MTQASDPNANARPSRAMPSLPVSGFWLYVLVFLLIYLFLRFGFGYVSQAIVGSEGPLPIPSRLLSMYLALVVIALAVQVAVDDKSLREFRDPLVAILRGPGTDGPGAVSGAPVTTGARALRLALLAVMPLLAAFTVYQQLVPKVASAATSRQQHPALPSMYADIVNPFRALPDAERQAAIEEGVVLYEVNCRPCHGTPADGEGPMALGFRPRPIAFTDPGTIDTIIESYLVWRIKTGGLGLPSDSTPWNSAMPPWEGELTDDEIWKIIMAEYAISGKEPRLPEAAH